MSNQRYPSAARTATLVGDDNTAVLGASRLTIMLDVTAVPGVETVTLILEGKDPFIGKYYTIGQTAARSAIGTDVLQVAAGLTPIANQAINAVVPRVSRVRVVHSGSGSFTYAVSVIEG